jgi:hypothetical protein
MEAAERAAKKAEGDNDAGEEEEVSSWRGRGGGRGGGGQYLRGGRGE